jgi:hypothetical protein
MAMKVKVFSLFLALGLLVASIVLYVVFGLFAIVTKASFGLTVVAFILYVILNRDEILRFFKKSASVTTFYKILQIGMVFGILVFIYLLSDFLSWKLDLTSGRLYSFSEETKSVLKGITNDFNILLFKSPDMRSPLLDYQENLLKAYAEKNKRVHLEKIDPIQNSPKAFDYNVKEGGAAVFEYQGNKITVDLKKIFDRDQETGDISYKGEEVFTKTIKSLLASKPKNVYLLVGHGEGNPYDRGNNGFKGIFEKISEDNVKLNQLNLLSIPEIPVDCSLIVIVNPVKPVFPEELDKIVNYMRQGGSVLVLLEYQAHITINDILRQMGLFYLENLAIEDEDYNPQLGRTTIIPKFVPGEMTSLLIQNRIPVEMRTAVGILELPLQERPKDSVYEIIPLLKSSKNSFGETSRNEISSGKVSFDKRDLKGPLSLGYAVRAKRQSVLNTRDGETTNTVESRMAVFGDADFVNNTYFERGGNADLFLNTMNFLLKREAAITVRPKKSAVTGFQLTGSERRFLTIFAFSIFVLYLMPGVFIFLKRRSKVKE